MYVNTTSNFIYLFTIYYLLIYIYIYFFLKGLLVDSLPFWLKRIRLGADRFHDWMGTYTFHSSVPKFLWPKCAHNSGKRTHTNNFILKGTKKTGMRKRIFTNIKIKSYIYFLKKLTPNKKPSYLCHDLLIRKIVT